MPYKLFSKVQFELVADRLQSVDERDRGKAAIELAISLLEYAGYEMAKSHTTNHATSMFLSARDLAIFLERTDANERTARQETKRVSLAS